MDDNHVTTAAVLRLLPLIIGPAILVPLAVYAFRHRGVRGATWYGTLLVTIAFWSAVYAFELAVGAPSQKLLALKLKYLGVAALPLAWIAFILDFVAWDPTVSRRIVTRMAAVAVVTVLVAWTNEWHALFWGEMALNPAGAFYTWTGRGPGFWFNVLYTYAALFAGLAILVAQAVQSPYLYRKRAVILVVATVLPWIGNFIFVAGGEAPGTVDATPFLFSCTAVIAAVAVFRYGVLEPIPTLRDARIEVIGDGVVILDRSGRIADLNRAAEAALGRDRASAAGEAIDHVVPDWPWEIDHETRRDFTLTSPSGSRLYDVRITPILTRNRQLTGYVMLLRDVTERRHAEAALRRSEQRYRELVENARDLICTCDLDGRIVSINRAGLELTGYSREQVIGRTLLDMVAPESRERLQQVVSSAQSDRAFERTEITLLTDRGHRIGLDLASWIQHRDGMPIAIQAIGRDVTERRRLEEDLRHAQKMEAVGKLAGGIAHDFNNLLTAILGFAALAEDHEKPGTPMHEWIVQIRHSSEQAATLTRQLLAFGRRQPMQAIDLDLNRVVDDIQKMLRRLIGENIALTAELAPNLKLVRADVSQIQQVIVNLAVNARDAMPHGGRLTLRTQNIANREQASHLPEGLAGEYVALVVEDTGEGVDPAILERIFEPFFTTKPLGRGTGLGLATVYGIVKQSKGDVQVRSTPGEGTTFTVLLPAVTSSAVASEPQPS